MCQDISVLLDPALPLYDPPLFFLRPDHATSTSRTCIPDILFALPSSYTNPSFSRLCVLNGKPASTSSPSTSPNPQPSPQKLILPLIPTNITSESDINNNVFHFYFLIIAIAVIAFFLTILYISRRKKRKAEIMRSNSQRALARDVEGFRRLVELWKEWTRLAYQHNAED